MRKWGNGEAESFPLVSEAQEVAPWAATVKLTNCNVCYTVKLTGGATEAVGRSKTRGTVLLVAPNSLTV